MNTYQLRKTLAQVSLVLALFAPADAGAVVVAPSPSASDIRLQAASIRYADPASSSAEYAAMHTPHLTTALIDEAMAEVEHARRLLECTQLYRDRSFTEYWTEVGRAMEAWRAMTPHAQSEGERVRQLLEFQDVTAAGLDGLSTSLALARERLSDSVETLSAWSSIQRAADDRGYVDVPARFIDDTPVAVSLDSATDPDRIQTWLDLNEV